MPLAELTGGDHALLEAAREVIRRNYDAAERLHTVGAAVRCGSGRVYTGVNVYALHGACAEQVALGCAIAHGERTFEAIAAVRGPAGEEVIPPVRELPPAAVRLCAPVRRDPVRGRRAQKGPGAGAAALPLPDRGLTGGPVAPCTGKV